jgi:hypothetical protein
VITPIKNRETWALQFLAIVLLVGGCVCGCRTVAPIHDLRSSTAPDISRVMLKNGDVIVFNGDFGWYNQKGGTIEGMTIDSQHVEYHLTELSKVETVRTYSLAAAFLAAGVLLGFGIYLLAKLLAIV